MNESNLIPNSERSPEEVRENGRKGGIASGVARRRKKTLKEAMDLLLSLPLKDPKVKKEIEKMGINPDDIDNQMAIAIAQWKEAAKGNTKAYANIEATIGEKNPEKIEVSKPIDETTKEVDDYLCKRKH